MRYSLYVLMWVLMVESLFASPTTTRYEIEPNNTPATATHFRGEMVLYGAIEQGDQDAYLWEIDSEASAYSWDMILTGLPHAMTRIDVMRLEKRGEKISYRRYFSFGTRTGNRPVELPHLLFDKGQYLIAVTAKPHDPQSANRRYSLEMRQDQKSPARIKESSQAHAPHFAPKPQPTPHYYHYAFEQSSGWLQFRINAKERQKLWTLRGISSVGHSVAITLVDEAGERIAEAKSDRFGKFVLRDLRLYSGRYFLHFQGDSSGLHYGMQLYSTGTQKITQTESEPNDKKPHANRITLTQVIHGQANRAKDRDYFSFAIPKRFEGMVCDITLESEDTKAVLSLGDSHGTLLQKQTQEHNGTMSHLGLSVAQEYLLWVDTPTRGSHYTLKFSPFRSPLVAHEIEPNDSLALATPLVPSHAIEGLFRGRERDCFGFTVDRANRLWHIDAKGEGLRRISLFKGASSKKLMSLSRSKQPTLALTNLLLLMGEYRLCLWGDEGSYRVRVEEENLTALGIDSLDQIEHEPNQNERQTNALAFDTPIQGSIQNRKDEDYYHFTLRNYESIRLRVTPPQEGIVHFVLKGDLLRHSSRPSQHGEEAVIEGIYPPGRYTLELWSDHPSLHPYTLQLSRTNFFTATEQEPNDQLSLAQTLPMSFHLKGYSNARDDDYVKLPSQLLKESNLTISGANLKDQLLLYHCSDKKDAYIPLKWEAKRKVYTAQLKTPARTYLKVKGGIGAYDYTFDFSAYTPHIPKALPLSLRVTTPPSEPLAYHALGQRVRFVLELESNESLPLHLTTHLSDASWQVESNKSVTLLANEPTKIPFEVRIPKQCDTTPVVVTVKYATARGDFKTLSVPLLPKTHTLPSHSYEDWGLPKALLGGLNVARLDFGATRVPSYPEQGEGYVPSIANGYQLLFDDIVYKNSFYLYTHRDTLDENVTIALAGREAVEVVGVSLNPLGRGSRSEQLKAFSISLSEDGTHFTRVYRGELGLAHTDQVFAFDRSYRAKYARLTLHSNHANQRDKAISLGEWKVIAKQESLTGIAGFNIADPRYGGHIVKASTLLSSQWDRAILTPKADVGSGLYLHKEAEDLSWVVGFHHERMAKLTDMVWHAPTNQKPRYAIQRLKVSISTTTPNGPWREVNGWVKGKELESHYHFETPTWARYVKFEVPLDTTRYYALPETLEIYEAKPSSSYASILGEWGVDSHRAFYEYSHPDTSHTLAVIEGNERQEDAYPLESNQTVTGQVSVANHQADWYQISIPKGENHLTVRLAGREGVDVTAQLFDSTHHLIEPSVRDQAPNEIALGFEVAEGNYTLRVTQPIISVIFAWDNSGSVSPYHKEIFNTVNNYIRTIEPHIDAVNLLCFNQRSKLILADFSDDTHQIETIFNNFIPDCSDSDAERPLRVATQKLQHREGTKGVILIGDGVGNRDITLWDSLAAVKPKVFAIRVQSQYQNNPLYTGVMQSWSRVNNGTYSVVNDAQEMYHAIDLATAILRRPVFYRLEIAHTYQRPLGAGSLRVIEAPSQTQHPTSNLAIELILDASGSMLQRIHGKRRIAIAREVLTKAIKQIIPPKTPIALRVFGHKQSGSCRTDLAMRLQPLNPTKTLRILSKIRAKNRAKTPIAESLAKVASDLAKSHGTRVVILVTDGEETCGGDPAKEIAHLKAQGFEVRINIVGFAIDDEALKAQFRRWAKLGNGAYFEANDKHSLERAIHHALQVPYRVYTPQGEYVASGIVGGDRLSLKGGHYRVVVASSPERVVEDVVVVGEKPSIVTLKE